MNQKPFKYILITALCIVWGVIFYKVLAAFENPKEIGSLTIKAQTETNNVIVKDSLILLADYNDPFLPEDIFATEADITIDSIHSINQLPSRVASNEKQIKKEDLSFIQYLGSIYNSDKKIITAIIIFKGQELLLKKNDEIENIKIQNITKDQVTIIYNGQKHKIIKQSHVF